MAAIRPGRGFITLSVLGGDVISNQLVTLLSWSPSAGATSYKVYRGTSSGSYSNNWNVGNVTEYDVNLLTPLMVFGTTYYFAIAAIDGGGEGAKSSEIVVLNWEQQ
jgi:hypothetical protein